MANQMTNMPLIMDTATANWAANGLAGTQALKVYKILWNSPAAANDKATIKYIDGTTAWTTNAEAASGAVGSEQTSNFDPPLLLSKANGWFLSLISSGTLYIYYT